MRINIISRYIYQFALFLFVLGVHNPVSAANIEVTGFSDGTDSCVDTTDPVSCPSLRSAIIYANETSGADTVTLNAGEYVLSIAGVDETWTGTGTATDPYVPSITPDASKGDLDITDSITVNGATDDNGMLLTTIRWDMQSVTDPTVGDRIFHVQALTGGTPVSVTFSHLILTNGSVGVAPNTDPAASNPYDIDVVDNTPGATVIRQFRRMGGAVAIGPGASVVVYNEAVDGSAADPGDGTPMGPFPDGTGDPGIAGVIEKATFNHVAVVGNASGADGGGIYTAVPATIEQSVISGNASNTNGGGIYTEAAVTMSETTVGSTSSVPFLSDTTLTANGNTAVNGGGMFDTGVHTTTIIRSSIDGNSATYGGAIAGRALVEFNINNSTISGNKATIGAGITSNGDSTIKNSTISYNNNSVNVGGAGVNTYGSGTFTLGNTILSINLIPNGEFANCDCGHGNADCPHIITLGHNLESCLSCGFFDEVDGTDQSDTFPLLQPLANNGGLTETHALPQESPAVDMGDPDHCPGSDQRGVVRPQDGNSDSSFICDIGAYEYISPLVDLNISTITASAEKLGLNKSFTVTAAIDNPSTASDAALNVVISATVPNGLSNVSATLDDGTNNTNPCTVDTNTVTCPAITSMAPGQEATLMLEATTATEGTHTINVSVTSTADPVTANNMASIDIMASGSSDIALAAKADSSKVETGSNVTFTLTANNNGPDDATGLRFGASVPDGFELVSVTPNTGTCTNGKGDMNCDFDKLAASKSVSVDVVLKTLKAGTFTFSGQITADQNDSDTSNNSTTLGVTVTDPATKPGSTSGSVGSSSNSGGGGGGSGGTLAILASVFYLLRRQKRSLNRDKGYRKQ
jgi:uncharacterized repeat protein (TIGR01451 family)